MDETRRDQDVDNDNREASNARDDNDRDDLSRRREQNSRPPLTAREREERWPIG